MKYVSEFWSRRSRNKKTKMYYRYGRLNNLKSSRFNNHSAKMRARCDFARIVTELYTRSVLIRSKTFDAKDVPDEWISDISYSSRTCSASGEIGCKREGTAQLIRAIYPHLCIYPSLSRSMYLRSFTRGYLFGQSLYRYTSAFRSSPAGRAIPLSFPRPDPSIAISPFCGVGAAHNDNYQSPPRGANRSARIRTIDMMIYGALEVYRCYSADYRFSGFYRVHRNVKLAYQFKVGDRRNQSGAR